MEEKSGSQETVTKSFLIGKNLILVLAIILVVGISFGFYGFNELNPTGNLIFPDNSKKTDNSKTSEKGLLFELFVMSQCPYGTQAENTLIPVLKEFEDKINFKLHFIASENENGFVSLHGMPELNEDIRQTCMLNYVSQEKLFNYLSCVNKDIKNVESNWKNCAEQAGINTKTIESCSTSDKGKNLFKENLKRTNELQIGSSPSYYIDNEPYNGGRSTQDLTRTLCSYVDAKPCDELPPETEVNFFIVNDLDCKECDASGIAAQIKGFFPKLNVKELDYQSNEGKAVLDKFQAESLPFLYFDSTVTKHFNWKNFQYYTEEKDGLYQLNFTGTKFFKRTEKPNHIDLFVMSQCPYGIRAETNLKEVVEAIPGMTFNIYFISSETENGFSSLHGQVEVNEDIRQTCIMKYNRTKLLDYQACVNKDIKNVEGNWKSCAIKTELNIPEIESCFDSDEGKNLFKENIKEGNALKIGSSPTFIINGQTLFNASSAEAIKQVLCSYNDLAGCEKTLSGEVSGTAVNTGGSC